MPLLEISNLTHSFGAQKVVDRLSLSLAPGRIASLLGPSGCGKTTILRCIAGFEAINSGAILLDGQVVSSASRHVPTERRRIGMVFQDYALFPHLTVVGNIGFGLRDYSSAQRAARVEELLALVGLAHTRNNYPHELSGGQQQRVALARALAPRPVLLLLDEPFSSLDVDLRERLASEVRGILHAEGTTAVMVTHDQNEAFTMADEVGVMHAGCIAQWDTPYNLYHRPATRFVANFVGQGVFLPGCMNGSDQVRIELGLLPNARLAGSAIPHHGDAVCVLLRPDDVVHDDASGLKAMVVSKSFRGAEFLYTLQLASGQQVLSLVPSHHNHAVGEHIGIRLEVSHVVAFHGLA